jgi:hypothetical protein
VKTKISILLLLAVGAVTLTIAVLHHDSSETLRLGGAPVPVEVETAAHPRISEPAPPRRRATRERAEESLLASPVTALPATNKLETLKQIRESFVVLASGDPATAIRAAKEIKDETERETALLTLVTEWTRGELGPARARARAIAEYGLEAGLAMELSAKPDLAVLWANELTDGPGRTALLQQAASTLVDSAPSAAFSLAQHLPETERPGFVQAIFANWAGADTEAAFKYAEQLSDPQERSDAIAAIRTAAPVGIGAALKMEDGYAVINQLVPNTPAALSGQLRTGDRIVALAQGDNAFVDAHSLPLEKIVQMVRGLPDTVLQLQVLSADDPPNSTPRTVSLPRQQIIFKR